MDGMAMLTMDTSSKFMNAASSRIVRVSHRRGSARSPGAGGGARIRASEVIVVSAHRRYLNYTREPNISLTRYLILLDNRKVKYARRPSPGSGRAVQVRQAWLGGALDRAARRRGARVRARGSRAGVRDGAARDRIADDADDPGGRRPDRHQRDRPELPEHPELQGADDRR